MRGHRYDMRRRLINEFPDDVRVVQWALTRLRRTQRRLQEAGAFLSIMAPQND